MPSKKKKYNARFPAGRIKKIMQMDDDVGKIAHAVPVVISRSVELFINSLLNHTANITREKNAKTVSLSHTKHCILKEQKFEFLKDLVKNIADVGPEEEKTSSVSPEHSNETLPEKSRKRSAPDSHGSESAVRHGSETRTSKKRCSESEKNSSSSSKENSKTVSCSSRNSFSDSPNNKSENISKDLENSSYDLVIDETRDT